MLPFARSFSCAYRGIEFENRFRRVLSLFDRSKGARSHLLDGCPGLTLYSEDPWSI